MTATVTISAVQPALQLGAVEANLRRVEDLIRDAHREHHAEVIIVPEASTSPNVYSRTLRHVARSVDGAPFELYTRLARELGCVIGGGFLARRGGDVYGTYVLAEPDGRVHLHDKDIPTMWEQNYYRGGDDDGVTYCRALDAPVGLASGWEWARYRTARRLAGRIQLLLGGMCWPSYPLNWWPLKPWIRREHGLQRQFARELPRQVARLIGAPVAIASHVGDIAFETPLGPGIPWNTVMVGETQICERDGTMLARLAYEDGEGHVAAPVTLNRPEPVDPIDDRFWIPNQTVSLRILWHAMNGHGAAKYRAMRTLRRHTWQRLPAGDLPDEISPPTPDQTPPATTAADRGSVS
ncbi:carbon-nitrogen hydrolase family protein [Mycobacterium spongiae]|uniref:Carbon-nitrogen hydrolase family protein n=1 Tax=Mycobacterium spongiae TaxID=886343 RepID=A0A975PX39_9MYCO|nr:carbon-nitrogen hydrolase family protein [Mycobacterium spongiae]QUR67810.1 carbon-nitrogen hydrolase family protein [Mycobacterium spongiae]